MWPNPKEIVNLITFTEEILIGKLQFFLQRVLIMSGLLSSNQNEMYSLKQAITKNVLFL